MERWNLAALAMLMMCSVAACGGGGGGSASAPFGSASTSGAFSAHFDIVVPGASPAADRRAPRYLSAATKSIGIDVGYGGAAVSGTTADVVPGAPGCESTTAGVRCSVAVTVFPGALTFVVRAYDALAGRGAVLGLSSVAVPDAKGQPVVDVPVVLNGVVRSIALSLVGGPFQSGTPGARTLVVGAKDADGYTIIEPGAYDTPIMLSTSNAAVRLAPTTVSAPAATVVAQYDGTPTTTVAVTASTGGSAASTTVATLLVLGSGAPPSAGPSPTPSPTSTPSATPTPSPTASPTVIIRVH